MHEEMKLGITTRSYPGLTVAETAAAMREAGFVWCELCFCQSDLAGWRYNGVDDLSAITPDKVNAAAEAYRGAGVEPVALGIFGDFRHPDAEEHSRNMAYFKTMVDLAAGAGIGVVASECGFTPGRRGVNADTYAADYDRLKNGIAEVAEYAAERGVTVALEACLLDIIPSPRRMRKLIEQLRGERGLRNVKALLDPANYIANADEDDMFKYLAGEIAYFHGKDRKYNEPYGCNIGDGDIDWAKFMENYKKYEPQTPFVFEYCSGEAIGKAVETARKYYAL